MRQRVFGDDAARRRLEAIIHPRVRAQLQHECAAARSPYAIVAIPLLTEGGGRNAYPWLQRILVVDVPVDVQRARLMQRDGSDAALAERMIAAQASRAQRLAIADDVIVNDGGLELLDQHVARWIGAIARWHPRRSAPPQATSRCSFNLRASSSDLHRAALTCSRASSDLRSEQL